MPGMLIRNKTYAEFMAGLKMFLQIAMHLCIKIILKELVCKRMGEYIIKLAIFTALIVWICIEGNYFIMSLWEQKRLKGLLENKEITLFEYVKKSKNMLKNKNCHTFSITVCPEDINDKIANRNRAHFSL